MKVEKWAGTGEQYCQQGNEKWSVSRLIDLAKDLEVMKVPLDHLYVYYTYERMTLRDMAMHMKAVLESDLDKPIILDEDGSIMDGRHRVMKALIEGKKKIKAVRFESNPQPCAVKED